MKRLDDQFSFYMFCYIVDMLTYHSTVCMPKQACLSSIMAIYVTLVGPLDQKFILSLKLHPGF
jgi:hypothetical protein